MPFGNVVGADGKLVRDAKEQALVERIKELGPRRLTIKNIAATLNRDGAPARGGRWHATTVARLLRRAAWNARTPRRVTADLIVRADLRNSRISPRDLRSRMTKCSASGSIQHSLRTAFAYVMKKAKITKVGITAHHHARHSAATIAAGETQDMLAIRRWRQCRAGPHGRPC